MRGTPGTLLTRAILIAAAAVAVLVALGTFSAPSGTTATTATTATAARGVARPGPLTRYSLAHGCYAVPARGSRRPIAHGPFRMQPAALGIYLLYTRQAKFLAAGLRAVSTPSPATEWRVDGRAKRGFTVTNLATHTRMRVAFRAASGCAAYPAAGVDAIGPEFKGPSPEAAVRGTVEGHAHITAFEFFGGDWHCGRPWSPYGAPYALPASCAPDQQGSNGEVEDFEDWGGGPRPPMVGWPKFENWPKPTTLAEEGDYYTGIERAWKAGLRLLVTNLVDNEALCSVMTKRHNPCNDMAGVRIQNRDLHQLEGYIDAQSGGPGRGWFRLVSTPFQARRVISQGKLAVIEGIEVSRLFGCGEKSGVPQCDRRQINAGLKEVEGMGVRTFFPIHEFNNAFGGTKMIAGSQGTVVNAGNRLETGSFWTLQRCPARDEDAEQTSVPGSGPLAKLLNGPFASALGGNPVPVYGPGPQCNVRGLTGLGAYLIHKMIKQHLIIQLDHMDSKTATAALSIAEKARYAGVVSAHCCSSPQLFKRIYAAGGFVNPPAQPTLSLVGIWKLDKAMRDPKYTFGFGYGSDENGLAEQPGPSGKPISYPFRSYDGRVKFTQEQWGARKFNFNIDGLDNYGMYADWLHQLQLTGGAAVMKDMMAGAEAYLEMWERAYGVPASHCQAPDALGTSLRLGDTPERALYRAGQPLSRPGRSYRYCVSGGGRAAIVFGSAGRSVLALTTSRRAPRPTGPRHMVYPGVWLTGRHVYGAGFVALAAASELHSPARLRSDLRAAGLPG
ncbi:MAG TPA: Coagulation factor 5/8 type domain-containing protein [Solirubrobacteraceae bacterium]|jgi:hypothetical protein